MSNLSLLNKESTGLAIIDVQERLFPLTERSCDVLCSIKKAIRGFQTFNMEIILSEQYPQGLGSTIEPIRELLGSKVSAYVKTSFSCMGDSDLRKFFLNSSVENWVLAGIEAHICVLQTAKELLAAKKKVTILNDAITSRSIFDISTAIAELRDCGARISSTESVLFELLRDSTNPEFKKINEIALCKCC
jgi:nicotinamidase-related amidase